MEPIRSFTSRTVVLDRDDVDTDQIIPARFLKVTVKEGLGKSLFTDWRFDAEGRPKPEFILNRPEAEGCRVLVVGRNFGCGSSREHAPWALLQFGFRALIAPSFADIFFNNCTKNGLLPVVLPQGVVDRLFDELAAHVNYRLTVDLPRQRVVEPDGTEHTFEVAPFRKHCLLNGFDDIELTLRHKDKIAAFEKKRLTEQPWLAKTA
jgi:3-isopropylmalate/(R)-2-methylmalate dehydratase small subunit